MLLKTGSNDWRWQLVIWNWKTKMHLNWYKCGYRVNHGNSEISKIKKMAAFWNIDFSCAFRLSGGKKKKNRKKHQILKFVVYIRWKFPPNFKSIGQLKREISRQSVRKVWIWEKHIWSFCYPLSRNIHTYNQSSSKKNKIL